MKDQKVFTVTMQRYGDPEGHQYLDGIYTCLAQACIEGLIHKRYRANKYEPHIQEFYIDQQCRGLEISLSTAIDYAILKFPEKFNDRKELKNEDEN